MISRLALAALLLCGTPFAVAQETKESQAAAQRKVADGNLKQAELAKVVSAESAEIVLFTTLPEARAKTVVAGAQKAFDAANKVLKFGDMEKLWPGKLTVYFLPERRDFTALKRTLLPDNSEKRATAFARLRGNEPYILMGSDAGTKPTDAEVVADIGEAVAAAMLDHKSGVNPGTFDLPGWLRTGFGKAMVLRAEGNAAKMAAHKAKVRALFAKAKLPTFKAADVWNGTAKEAGDTLAVSLVEYFLFGLPPDKFPKLILGFKPNEQQQAPTAEQALEILELKPDMLDAAWKAWVAKQK